MGPGIRYADVGALCIALAGFAVAALFVPWHRLEEFWLLLLVGVPVVFVGALNSLTGAGQSPYFVIYAPILAIAGWYLSARQTGLVIGLVVGTELWRAFALDRSGSVDHLAIALPFVALIAATASLTSQWLRSTLIQTRRDQIRMAKTLDAVRALGSDPKLGVLTQLERAANRIFDAQATAIRIDGERPSDVELTTALVEEQTATVLVPGAQRLHALLRIETRGPLTAQVIRLAAFLAEAAGRTLDSQDVLRGSDAGRERDSLTGLPNRRALEQDVAAALGDAAGEAPDLALLYIEIDDFRQFDNRYGHAIGDAVLAALAGRLKAIIRPTDDAYGIGSGEFAILLRRGGRERAPTLADRIRRQAARSRRSADDAVVPQFGVSVGLALPTSTGSARDLLAAADQAIYEARQTQAAVIPLAATSPSRGVHL
jgi:diguanylate cyclase (GGDEF)-like protein